MFLTEYELEAIEERLDELKQVKDEYHAKLYKQEVEKREYHNGVMIMIALQHEIENVQKKMQEMENW